MKRTNILSGITLGLVLMFGMTNASAAITPETLSGESQTILGEYQITELAPETIQNATFRVFQLDYKNGNGTVTIYLNERSKCREYIVRSNVMEVQYTCNKQGFGASNVNSKYSIYPPQINDMFLSQEALAYQQKITEGEISIEKALGLIACYYPSLLKNIQNIATLN